MKKFAYILSALFAALALNSCQELDIPVYSADDSAVMFPSAAIEFSLKGVVDPESELVIKVSMYGPACDYDRQILVEVDPEAQTNDAVEGTDFTIVSAMVPAGELSGSIVLKIKGLTDEVESHTVTLLIKENEFFHRAVKDLNRASVKWSKEYVRPSNPNVYCAWWYFFCKGYSKKLHELIVMELGEQIEHMGYNNAARNDPECQYKVMSWWYTASRQLYEMVKAHDEANPGNPYMHSADYEEYAAYTVPVGEGKKPATIPTILSTLYVY